MNGNLFLVVLPAEGFRCVHVTTDPTGIRDRSRELGGLVAIVPASWPLSALVNFVALHAERSAAAFERSEWRRARIALDPVCEFCRRPLRFSTSTIDHVTPLSRGGADEPANWLLACRKCNEVKGDDTLEEFRERLLSGVLFDRRDVSADRESLLLSQV